MSNFVPQLAEETPNPTEYIAHHLTFLTNHTPKGLLDLSVVNYDSVFFAVLLAVVFGGTFIVAATPGDQRHAGEAADLRRGAGFVSSMSRSGASSRATTD